MDRFQSLRQEIARFMKPDRYEILRRWRCEEDATWRAIAALAAEEWPDLADHFGLDSTMPSQVMGEMLCVLTAEYFGENGYEAPWN